MTKSKNKVPIVERIDDLTFVVMLVITVFATSVTSSVSDVPFSLAGGLGAIVLFGSGLSLVLRRKIQLIVRKNVN